MNRCCRRWVRRLVVRELLEVADAMATGDYWRDPPPQAIEHSSAADPAFWE